MTLAAMTAVVLATTAPVEGPDVEPARKAEAEEEAEHRNAVSLKGTYVFQLHKDRVSNLEGAEAPGSDSLGGFIIAYERTVLPGWLGLEFAKPFYFAEDRFDSPFDITLKLFHRWKWFEPFVAAGITFNIRVFDQEREEIEGRPNELSAGVVAALGAAFWVSKRWGIEVEGGYGFIPIGELVEHEFTAATGPVFAF